MKIMVASDLHGYYDNAKKLVDIFNQSNAEKLFILGDIYHGYSYQESRDIANLFSNIVTKLYLIKGNCDTKFDEQYSPIGFSEIFDLEFNKRHIYFNHGHLGIPCVNFNPGDIYCYGHTHISTIKEIEGIIFCNPGSVSLPRGGTKASYMVIDDSGIYIYDFNQVEIINYKFEED